MLKKTTLAILGLVASSFASAGSMGPVCAPGNVTVPCETKQWSFGLQALYLDMFEGNARAYRYNGTSALSSVDENWDWGFLASGAYQFNTGNDATLSWMHINGSMDQAFPNGGPLLPIGIAEPAYSLVKKNTFDQVNAVLGQHVDVGLVKKMRFYGGLQYANIQSQANNFYPALSVPTVPTATSGNLMDNSDFKGVGAVIGLDYSYDLTSQISLTANGSSFLLYGTSRNSTAAVLNPIHLVPIHLYASKKMVVPGFEAKLGANYAYPVAQGALNLQAGYQVTDYFNVLQAHSLQRNVNVSFTDFALYGPYVGLKYVGNA